MIQQPESNDRLFEAVRQGNVCAVEDLLLGGADPNGRDRSGRTPLHAALGSGHCEIAACLLAYRADYRITDGEGRTPLDAGHTTPQALHSVRQTYHRFRPREVTGNESTPDPVKNLAEELQRRGILKLPGFVEKNTLVQMRRDFNKFIMELQLRLAKGTGRFQRYDAEIHFWPADRAFVTNNAFKYSAALVRLCCNDTILGIANLYLRRDAHIQRGVAMRYLPAESTYQDMFGWHHDMEEQRVKMMVLLTDIGETDQYMSYVLGSHKPYHPYEMFFKNECSLEYCRDRLGKVEILDTVGNAGDVFLFDSNGAHRGNRGSEAAVRDVFFIEYSADNSQVWGGDIDPSVFDAIDPKCARAFAKMRTAEKKWRSRALREAPNWIESLPDIASWL